MANQQVDLLIIGGGLIGATLLLALQGLGYRTLLVEAQTLSEKADPDFDARNIALSPASVRILNTLGLWNRLKDYACPIETIHVSDQHHFAASRLQGTNEYPLGYVIEMQYINFELHQQLNQDQLLAPATLKALDLDKQVATITTPTGDCSVTAKLIVAADGAESSVRKLCGLQAETKNYYQKAIVVNVALERPHHYRAFERFTQQGPLALLPMLDNRMSLIWAMKTHEADRMMAMNDRDFLKALQLNFGYRLGRFVQLGKRHTYPLKQVIMSQQTHWPVVFVGNAAHTLHPVAGQGFNLGLRDVATLAQCIADLGLDKAMLETYLRLRAHDQQVITRMTDGLIQLFTSRLPGIGIMRNLGLLALDNIPALKKLLSHYARGYGGVIPDLVCEMALNPREMK